MIIYPGKALGVSYTEEGLKNLMSSKGDMYYYKDAYFANTKDSYLKLRKGKVLEINRSLIVEDFIPHDHILTIDGNRKLHRGRQSAEIKCIDRALRMLYVPTGVQTFDDRAVVYSTADKSSEA